MVLTLHLDPSARTLLELRIGESSLDEIFVTLVQMPPVLASGAEAVVENQETLGV